MLAHTDSNGDQEISQDEFVSSVGRAIRDRPGFDAAVHPTATTLIQLADQDGNGVLDPGEYTRLVTAYGAGADEAAHAFGRLDLDHNELLDTAELTVAISQFFASSGPGVPGVAARIWPWPSL